MYLVEYTKKMAIEEKKFCLGYYTREDAMSRAGDLLRTSGVTSVTVSFIDNYYVNKIYDFGNLHF